MELEIPKDSLKGYITYEEMGDIEENIKFPQLGKIYNFGNEKYLSITYIGKDFGDGYFLFHRLNEIYKSTDKFYIKLYRYNPEKKEMIDTKQTYVILKSTYDDIHNFKTNFMRKLKIECPEHFI